MKTKSILIGLTALVSVCTACRDKDVAPVLSPDADPGAAPALVVVVGVIVEKDDQVPVDGGVTMLLEKTGGGTALLLFGSLFTSPPPSQEQIELYEVIAKVEIGDVVRATGTRSDRGIVLEALTIQDS